MADSNVQEIEVFFGDGLSVKNDGTLGSLDEVSDNIIQGLKDGVFTMGDPNGKIIVNARHILFARVTSK